MVRCAVVELSIVSLHEAIRGLNGKSQRHEDTQNTKHRPHSIHSTPHSIESKVVSMPYPIGSSTLQVTGVHVCLQCLGGNSGAGETEDIFSSLGCASVVVLIQAHVQGDMDMVPRVFFVAGVTFNGKQDSCVSEEQRMKRRAVTDARHATPFEGRAAGKSHNVTMTTFSKLDMRLQAEKVSFSASVFPMPLQSKGSRGNDTVDGYRKGNKKVPLVDCNVTVAIVGSISPLLL
uniref:Uncharacterized protein n=1 Tax=Trypanosoma vivax (strain Y486) TaxID=1055687 RepID=G0U056_TRYVY|nr:conserved hypothetical protein [Trypanosoma vivax Y486]